MTDREKLIEMLGVETCGDRECYGCSGEYDASVCDQIIWSQIADHLLANGVTFETDTNVGSKWISVTERMPDEFVSVLGHMTDAGPFPAVRECYLVGNVFFFPALKEVHPVDKWTEMPEPSKEV